MLKLATRVVIVGVYLHGQRSQPSLSFRLDSSEIDHSEFTELIRSSLQLWLTLVLKGFDLFSSRLCSYPVFTFIPSLFPAPD